VIFHPQLNITLAGGRSLSAQINRELVPTANQLRTMLSTADETAKSATRTSNIANQIMQELRPDLVMALKELSSAMRRTNRLLDQFGVLPLPSSENSAAPTSPIDHSSLQRSSYTQKQ
jgi:ABC-type transporter Mla subunit MlaD